MKPPDKKNTSSSPFSLTIFTGPGLMPVKTCECPGVIPNSPIDPVATTMETLSEKISFSALTMLHWMVDMLYKVFAFSTTSSILPTIKKACSGRSSYSPSKIPLNPRTVSLIETNLPGEFVKISATNLV